MITKAAEQVPERVQILDVPVDCVSMDDALALVEGYIKAGTPHLIVTADASGVVAAQKEPAFMEILRGADLVTPDSAGILWASRRAGKGIRARVSGVDLVDRICAMSADRGYRIYLLGAAPGVAEIAAEKLRLRHPGCNIVGTRHGYFPPESDEVVGHEVAAAKPDVLFVAMGIPRQEQFIRATQDIIQAPVAMGVGGSLDVFSGRTKRAPVFMQRLQLEWLWRVLLNPKKFSKVMCLPQFVWLVLKSRR
jgi:N-acetylglucosaminyldiphosphoundecaprenol N-acetyl-beta-D-mannosaminyltransferase